MGSSNAVEFEWRIVGTSWVRCDEATYNHVRKTGQFGHDSPPCEARALYAEPSIDVLERAYWLGWRNSAAWADRKDLWADRDSPAYTQERDDALGTLAAAIKLGKE